MTVTITTKETLALQPIWTDWVRFCNGKVLHKIRLGHRILQNKNGCPPKVNLAEEKNNGKAIQKLIKNN